MIIFYSLLRITTWSHTIKFSLLMIWLTSILWVSYTWFLNNRSIQKLLVHSLGLTLIIFFSSFHLWWLIVLFETSLLPIILIILGWGRQNNRLPASLYLLTYTTLFSLPALFLILSICTTFNLQIKNQFRSLLLKTILIIAFLVKLPIFGLHPWLAKAHVESPTLGSAILAGILLKTGRYGIWLIRSWLKCCFHKIWFLLGATFIATITAIQIDVKKSIAFSRVIHLNLSLARFSLLYNIGESTFLLIALTHGFISSSLFFLAGQSSKQRRLIFWLNQTRLINWLLILSLNLSLPPAPSFWSEFITFSILITLHFNRLTLLIFSALRVAWFTFIFWLNLKSQVLFHPIPLFTLVLSPVYTTYLIWTNPTLFLA